MITTSPSRILALGFAFLVAAAGLNAATETTGPSTAVAPYLSFDAGFVAANPNADLKAIRSVEDRNNFGVAQMTGIPDGMGAFDNGDGTFTLLVNQEINPNGSNPGNVRSHGQKGAFVSRWIINKTTFHVVSIDDLATSVATWNGAGHNDPAQTTSWSRFCSATVPAVSALYNAATGKGTTARAIMNGEESGEAGKAWIHFATGSAARISYELPHLGRMSYENCAACPFPQDTTIVVSQDDRSGRNGNGGVYVYVGTKRSIGNEAEKAGLVGGITYGVKVGAGGNENIAAGSTAVSGAKGVSTAFTLVSLGDVSAKTTTSGMVIGNTLTWFGRPEDGSWDPRSAFKNDYYFLTTASSTEMSRLYRLRFDDITNPAAGGQITCLLDGTETQVMMDNLTVGSNGKIYTQEDPGGNSRYSKIWEYDTATGAFTTVASFKSSLFNPGGAPFTNDEESSGIFDASDILGAGKYIFNAQVHTDTDLVTYPGAVEHGQMLVLSVPGASEVSSRGISYNRARTVATQTFTVKNNSGASLTGPVKLAFAGLPAGTSVISPAGTATVYGKANTPYVNVTAGDLAAGLSASVNVRFTVPVAGSVSCAAVVIP